MDVSTGNLYIYLGIYLHVTYNLGIYKYINEHITGNLYIYLGIYLHVTYNLGIYKYINEHIKVLSLLINILRLTFNLEL